jgi:phosphatidylserine decarboxylase
MATIRNSFIYVILWLVPKNIFSRFLGFLVSLKLPKNMALFVNKSFVSIYKLTMSEAEKDMGDYACLQDLFTRRLKASARVLDTAQDCIISPCDGVVSEAGVITRARLLQIKGKYYSLRDLLGCEELAARFDNGHFATIYLSPRDYHRFHVPLDARLRKTVYIPGTLWPVNEWAVATVKNLFGQNERIISVFDADYNHKQLAHVAVGACVVGKIKMSYCSLESNTRESKTHMAHDLRMRKGEDLGVFMFGSTIIMLFESGLITNLLVTAPTTVRMGQALARLA